MRQIAAVALVMAAGLAGCSTFEPQGPHAFARLDAASGSAVWGSVSFVETGKGVLVRADVRNLPVGGEFGFHVHEKGDCSSGDGMSTGGHFNPTGKPHGPQAGPHHAGDMPSLKADASGVARGSFVLDDVTVVAGPASVVGRGLIVHKDPDDYKTQPTGNAGARVACAVIRAS